MKAFSKQGANRWALALPMIRREVIGRYRGSLLGILWSLLTPLLMLAVYTFVFGTIFKARWAGASEDASVAEFAVILFSGLISFQLFAEVIGRAPGLILSNQNYVKKVVFPLEVLIPVALGSALFHAAVSYAILLVFIQKIHGIPWTALLLPLVIAPFCLLILGLSWFLASIGTFVRDIGQFVGTVVTALLFLSPVFYPISALPAWLQPWLMMNPAALPVTLSREVLIFGKPPDFSALGLYTLIAAAIAGLGYLWFQKTRKGFADVL
ncbi:ABC transporter permease [Tepidamorphus sp. 3E244]|uniref:ABC transporter permease n=1 Tax=Tepidamorphus sp. 3E244 TaxID=3385498 RepID=UPI0038FCD7C5